MIVYKATNTINGKIYVGITKKTVEERIREHERTGYLLTKAFKKYGRNSFLVEQIDTAEDWKSLCEKEKQWIAHYDCIDPKGYNIARGGDGGQIVYGFKHSPEVVKKLSERMKGNRYGARWERTEEWRIKMSAVHTGNQHWLGKKHTEETKRKISAGSKRLKPMLGIKHSDETRIKMSASQMGNQHWVGKKHTETTIEKMSESGKRIYTAERHAKLQAGNAARWADPVRSAEARRKMSIAAKARRAREGDQIARAKNGRFG